MSTTYRAILRGDRLEWSDDAPDVVADQPVEVTVIVKEINNQPIISPQGARMAEALARLAALEERSDIPDPAAWEREIRKDRPLPGRED